MDNVETALSNSNTGIDPNTGLTDAQRQMLGFNTIGSIGAMLLAAGQKQMPADRAKYLAQLGNIPGQMYKSMDVMQQAQLRQVQMQKAQQELLQMKAWRDMLNGGGQPTAAPPAQSVDVQPQVGGAATGSVGEQPQATAQAPSFPVGSPAAVLAKPMMMPPAAAAAGNGGQNAPATLNSPTIPNIVQNMDPTSRALLGAMGPQAGANLLANETFNRARQNTEIAAANQRQQQQIEAENKRQKENLSTEVVKIPIQQANGSVIEINTTRDKVPAVLQQYSQNGAVAGKPEFNPEQTERLKYLGEEYKSLMEGRNSAVDLNSRLSQMESALTRFNPGAGSEKFYNTAAWANSFLPDSFLPSSMSKEALSGYQEFNKNAIQYGTEQARKLGAREAASVVQMMVNANPNPELTDVTIKNMVNGLRAQNDYASAKADAAEAWLADPKNKGSLEGFSKAFTKNNIPEKFLVPYLTPEQLKNIPDSVLKRMVQ
jgi:hypothetical protein